ncbi:PACE efflux transporter [Halioxenophilus sp. WMMB6]|uniref:PACE efflux transporter n=1 Tax=Halioxenophilus sp. WMMB6 TaxID=3073815 RepID=UPI00295EDBED|nr:PACE efflux transporter [Halioxenophilus sp. WMMB6]
MNSNSPVANRTTLTPTRRRILQALLYETLAVAFVGPVLSLFFTASLASTTLLALTMSAIALAWNYLFNLLFELCESRAAVAHRSWRWRLAHGAGFEGGLVILLVPLTAWWLETSLYVALLAEMGLLAYFFIYAIVFTWAFDRIFGLPQSVAR